MKERLKLFSPYSKLTTKALALCILCSLFVSCRERRSSIIYLSPKDRSQTITVISDYYDKNERIIAVGRVTERPKNNYIKLDISDIVELGDEIGVCWNTNKKGWQIVNNDAKVTHVALDTTVYIFKSKWYEDEMGIPNTEFYRKENCYSVGTLPHDEVYPLDNGFIERSQ